jgi:asparagine synthase (glutamine-hydrolysing)
MGNSFIRPWRHAALEFFHIACPKIECPERRIFLGREKVNDTEFVNVPESGVISVEDAEGDAIIDAARNWPLGAIAIEIFMKQEKVDIYRSVMASCAFYAAIGDGSFYGDWDFTRLAAELPCRTPNWRCIASTISMEYYDIAEATPIQEIMAVPAAAVCRLGKECAVQRPPALPVTRPRLLKEGAKPLEAFEELLDMVIARQLPAEGAIGVDISGGLDCAIVGHALSRVVPGRIKSFGMLVPGPGLKRQEWRREEALAHIGANDHMIMADTKPGGIFTVEPWPLVHTCPEIQTLRARQIREAGCAVLFGGTGGDELTILGEAEYEFAPHDRPADDDIEKWGSILKDDTPRLTPVQHTWPHQGISTSGLYSMWLGATDYMRAGVWPIQPFCSAEMSQFARSLPTEWRAKRRLSRAYLSSRRFNDYFCYGKSKENEMRGYMTHIPMAVEWARQLRKNSRLIEGGVVDADRLEELCQQLGISGDTMRDNLLSRPLYIFVQMERLLEMVGA